MDIDRDPQEFVDLNRMSVMIRYLQYVCRKRGIPIDWFYRIQISNRHIIMIGNREPRISAIAGGDDVMITQYINIYLR